MWDSFYKGVYMNNSKGKAQTNELEHEFAQDEIKTLAKFFSLLWETQKELRRQGKDIPDNTLDK